MISVEQATNIILEQAKPFGVERIPFDKSLGRVLAEDIVADTDLPPFNRVMMDGIAIRKEDFDNGTRTFRIADMQRAGDEQKTLIGNNTAIEIMTGAVLPIHADAIIPYEEIHIEDGNAHIQASSVSSFQNIHLKGSDKRQGDVLVKMHTRLTPVEIAIAASVGKTEVNVLKLPRIHIFSTGDELVEPNETPLAHQIRRSNVYALQQILLPQGIEATQSHIPDDYDSIAGALSEALKKNEVILLTGGVSKGKYDLIPKALEACGVEQKFHRISQRPGKPMWFGMKKETAVFAFPGNPVSTFMCATRYLLPFLRRSFLQEPFPQLFFQLAEDFKPHPKLTFFLQVKIKFDSTGRALAIPIRGNGSGDYSNLAEADAFVEVKASDSTLKKGAVIQGFSFRKFFL